MLSPLTDYVRDVLGVFLFCVNMFLGVNPEHPLDRIDRDPVVCGFCRITNGAQKQAVRVRQNRQHGTVLLVEGRHDAPVFTFFEARTHVVGPGAASGEGRGELCVQATRQDVCLPMRAAHHGQQEQMATHYSRHGVPG